MQPSAPQQALRSTIAQLASLDVRASERMERVVARLGWSWVCSQEGGDIVRRLRRLYGDQGIEFAEVILRVRRGERPDVVASETSHRWTLHRTWARDFIASRVAHRDRRGETGAWS